MDKNEIKEHFYRIQLDFKDNKKLSALQKLYALLRETPDYLPAMKLLKDIYISSNQLNESEKIAKQMIEINDSGETRAIYGHILLLKENYQEALKYLKKAEMEEPNNPELLHAMGFCYLKTERLDKALEYFEKLDQNGIYFEGMGLLLGELYYDKQQYELTVQIISKALKLEGERKEFYLLMGDSHLIMQHWVHALKNFKHALAMMPDDYKLNRSIGWVLCNMNNYRDGIKFLKKSIRSKTDYIEGRISLAIAYLSLGEYEKSIKEFEAVLKLEPENEIAKEYIEKVHSLS